MKGDHHQSSEADQAEEIEEKRFHGWRLLGVIILVVVLLGLISALVDWIVIGPLEGRAF
jgi:hypothetical protein